MVDGETAAVALAAGFVASRAGLLGGAAQEQSERVPVPTLPSGGGPGLELDLGGVGGGGTDLSGLGGAFETAFAQLGAAGQQGPDIEALLGAQRATFEAVLERTRNASEDVTDTVTDTTDTVTDTTDTTTDTVTDTIDRATNPLSWLGLDGGGGLPDLGLPDLPGGGGGGGGPWFESVVLPDITSSDGGTVTSGIDNMTENLARNLTGVERGEPSVVGGVLGYDSPQDSGAVDFVANSPLVTGGEPTEQGGPFGEGSLVSSAIELGSGKPRELDGMAERERRRSELLAGATAPGGSKPPGKLDKAVSDAFENLKGVLP